MKKYKFILFVLTFTLFFACKSKSDDNSNMNSEDTTKKLENINKEKPFKNEGNQIDTTKRVKEIK